VLLNALWISLYVGTGPFLPAPPPLATIPTKEEVIVPDLLKKDVKVARQLAQSRGLLFVVFNNDTSGVVIKQSIRPHDSARRGETIIVLLAPPPSKSS
jgi:beta-lactam-binding protein with PASTA domain